jgi:23S rRNA pseudouridine2457 synthase
MSPQNPKNKAYQERESARNASRQSASGGGRRDRPKQPSAPNPFGKAAKGPGAKTASKAHPDAQPKSRTRKPIQEGPKPGAKVILFNKPFGVLSQFTSEGDKPALSQFIQEENVYAAGRLDHDSEGLLLLTDDGAIQHRLAHPRFKFTKTYLVQVEGIPTEEALEALRKGIVLKDGLTAPAEAKHIEEPKIWERNPPIRYRAEVPTSWIELKITEGRNRQVRRMTAHVGFPTLRLIRSEIGHLDLFGLQPGQSQKLNREQVDWLWKKLGEAAEDRPNTERGSKKSPRSKPSQPRKPK